MGVHDLRRLALFIVLSAGGCISPNGGGGESLGQSGANKPGGAEGTVPGDGTVIEGGGNKFPDGCKANSMNPPGGASCTASCADCDCGSIKYVCDKACYTSAKECLINANPDGTAKPGAGFPTDCKELTCVPENDLSKELVCTASKCTPPPATTPPPPPPKCPEGGTPPPGTFGTKYECYGISAATGEVFSLDKVGKKVSVVCTKPAGLGPLEAFAISPITGNSYIVAQETNDFGKFLPKDAVATCVFTSMGKFPSTAVGGFAFAPDGFLYAGEEGSGKLWKFRKDPVTGDPIAQWDLIGTLPNGSEGLAVSPKDKLAYNTNGSTLHIVDLTDPGKSLFSCSLGGNGFESIFFDKDGVLYSTNNGTNQFVSIAVNRTAGTCTVTNLFSVLPAEELEASDCNSACAYDTCVCKQ
jgi:hypothetical protein